MHSYRTNAEDSVVLNRSTLVLTVDGMSWTLPAAGSTLSGGTAAAAGQTYTAPIYITDWSGGDKESTLNALNALNTDIGAIRTALIAFGIITP